MVEGPSGKATQTLVPKPLTPKPGPSLRAPQMYAQSLTNQPRPREVLEQQGPPSWGAGIRAVTGAKPTEAGKRMTVAGLGGGDTESCGPKGIKLQ